jgi:hypothetical protein|nr:MAG TPA: hypothetical protein [Caudoviricetes sp.]
MAKNSNYNPEKKTTKRVRGIHSLIKFQKHQGVESLTIQGKDTLADVSQDKNGDTNLILMADSDKVNAVTSNVPYLGVSHSFTGEDPDNNKTANISQDLTQFPLSGGELVTITKELESLTIHDEKVKEFVTNAITEALSNVPITVAHWSKIISQFEKHTTNISLQDDDYFNNYVLLTVISPNNALSQFRFTREDFLDSDKPYKIVNDFTISVKAELTEDKHLAFTFNTHDIVGIDSYQLMIEWFTNYKKAPTDSIYNTKLSRVIIEYQSEHFEGYKNPLSYEPNQPLEYKPITPPAEINPTPSAPPITASEPETVGNFPQPLPEESH